MRQFCLLVTFFLGLAGNVFAQVVGYTSVTIMENSDTYISLPLGKNNTLAGVFPPSEFGKSFNALTELYIYSNAYPPSVKVATYLNGHWVGTGVSDGMVLEPEAGIVVRNRSGSRLRFIGIGEVKSGPVSRTYNANKSYFIGNGFPVNITLNNSGWGKEGNQVLFYDNTVVGMNKNPSRVATFRDGVWTGTGITGEYPVYQSQACTLKLGTSAGAGFTTPRPYPDYTTPSGKSIKIIRNGTKHQLVYTGVLQVSSDLINWTDHPGGPRSPFDLSTSSVKKFYRVR